MLGQFTGVELAEGVGAEGVHHALEIDLAHTFEHAHVEGVMAQQLAGAGAFDVPFLETGNGLLDGHHLGGGEFHRLLQGLRLEPEQPVEAGTQAVLVEDLLDGGAGHEDATQLELGADPDAAADGILAGYGKDLFDHLRRGGGRMAVMNGRQVLEPGQAVGLEAALVLVEGGAVHLRLPAGGGDVAQGLGQLEDVEPMPGYTQRHK